MKQCFKIHIMNWLMTITSYLVLAMAAERVLLPIWGLLLRLMGRWVTENSPLV
jgi:hypothetical protein